MKDRKVVILKTLGFIPPEQNEREDPLSNGDLGYWGHDYGLEVKLDGDSYEVLGASSTYTETGKGEEELTLSIARMLNHNISILADEELE